MESPNQNRARMTAERHWERFDEACHGNAQQMTEIAEDAIEELLQREQEFKKILEREREFPRLKPHLFQQLVIDIQSVVSKYGATQQMRTHLVKIIEGYVKPDHPHTRPK